MRKALHLDGETTEVKTELAFDEVVDAYLDLSSAECGDSCNLGPLPVNYSSGLCSAEVHFRDQPWCLLDLGKLRALPPANGNLGLEAGDPAVALLKSQKTRIAVRIEPLQWELNRWLVERVRFAEANRACPAEVSKGVGVDSSACSELGYRYRLPAEGRVRVMLVQHTDDGDKWTVLADSREKIAQFGPIATLPESFHGREVAIDLKLTDTGSISELMLGQKAYGATGATGLLDALADEKAKHSEATAKAAEAAAKAPLEQAQRQTDLLEAQLKKAKYERCLKLLANDPNAVLPEGCP